MEHAHFIGCGLGEALQTSLMLARWANLETWQKEKRDPDDADDAGQGGQHHQHHWGSVSPFLASRAPNDPSLVKIVSHPKLPLGLGASFQNGPCS